MYIDQHRTKQAEIVRLSLPLVNILYIYSRNKEARLFSVDQCVLLSNKYSSLI